MEIRSRLVQFLCEISYFDTLNERQAVIRYLVTPDIRYKINWEGSAFTFVNNLLITLTEDGRDTLTTFLASLEESDDLFGKERQEYLRNIRMSIEALTPDYYELE